MLCKLCSATPKALVCYQHCFSHKCKTQLRTSCCPSQTQYKDSCMAKASSG